MRGREYENDIHTDKAGSLKFPTCERMAKAGPGISRWIEGQRFGRRSQGHVVWEPEAGQESPGGEGKKSERGPEVGMGGGGAQAGGWEGWKGLVDLSSTTIMMV